MLDKSNAITAHALQHLLPRLRIAVPSFSARRDLTDAIEATRPLSRDDFQDLLEEAPRQALGLTTTERSQMSRTERIRNALSR
jgi:hypothetical protein